MSSDPMDRAKASLEEAWRAAKTAAGGVKKEIERAGIARSLDDAGKEIARAATSVATHLGTELEELGREIRQKAEAKAEAKTEGAKSEPHAAAGASPPAAPGEGGGFRIADDDRR
jgi:hypothetical protein